MDMDVDTDPAKSDLSEQEEKHNEDEPRKQNKRKKRRRRSNSVSSLSSHSSSKNRSTSSKNQSQSSSKKSETITTIPKSEGCLLVLPLRKSNNDSKSFLRCPLPSKTKIKWRYLKHDDPQVVSRLPGSELQVVFKVQKYENYLIFSLYSFCLEVRNYKLTKCKCITNSPCHPRRI